MLTHDNYKSLLPVLTQRNTKNILSENLLVTNATGNYANINYIHQHSVPIDRFTYCSSGDLINRPLSLAFDNKENTFWASTTVVTETTKSYIMINFTSFVCIEAIIYGTCYATNRSVIPNTRRYGGYPLILNVYTSINKEDFELRYTFSGSPKPTDLWNYIQFVFSEPIWCIKLKLEFVEVTLDVFFSNNYTAACHSIYFMMPEEEEEYISMPIVAATGNYNNNDFLRANRIPTSNFTVYSPGDKEGHPISNLFDNSFVTYWVSSTVNNNTFKNYLTFHFNNLTCLEAIVFNMAYITNEIRRYYGAPYVLKIFTSINDEPFKLNHIFTGGPSKYDIWSRLQFVFEKPIWCNKLKIEFTEITLDVYFGNDYSVACSELYLINATEFVPTQTPVQIPPQASPSSIPKRTDHPGLDDFTYIDKNFTGSIPVSDNNQIQLGGFSQFKQISGCRFTNLEITNRQFFIKVNGESSIFDNVFEYTTYTTGKTGAIWYAYGSDNKFVISNCKFIRISGKELDSSVLNVNANTRAHIVFRDCEFIDCGEKGNDRPIVNILTKSSTIEFYDCSFSYEVPQISRVLELKGNGATFDGCDFHNCGTNSIDIGISNYDIDMHGVFQFTNNHVHSVNTRFINAPLIRAKPIISGNTFESCTLNGEYFIYIVHNQTEIEFKSNTFKNIISSGTSDGNCGGLSAFVERSDSKFKLSYESCHFINIINEHQGHPSNQGGAFQYFSANNFEVGVEFSNCEFKSNKAPHHGGAISIQACGEVIINGCLFDSNEANFGGSSSVLLYNNYYDLKSKGFGGAVYLNPTFNANGQNYSMNSIIITNCTFKRNRAYQGYAIYIEGENSQTIYSIYNNSFIDNYEAADSPENNSIVASEVFTISKEEIKNNNTFTNTNQNSNSKSFNYVDHYGNHIPDISTMSQDFTKSFEFTHSELFSPSLMFSKSVNFESTKQFSKSSLFTKSNEFTRSNSFSPSFVFSKSDDFERSSRFSKSSMFTSSAKFTSSNWFSPSFAFSKSDDFESSVQFSKSSMSTSSDKFTSSNWFSPSFAFTNEDKDASDSEIAGVFTSLDHPENASSEEEPSSSDDVQAYSSPSSDQPDGSTVTNEISTRATSSSSPYEAKPSFTINEKASDEGSYIYTPIESSNNDSSILNGSSSSKNNKISVGAILGIVFGVILLILVVSLVIFFVIKRNKKKDVSSYESRQISNKETSMKEDEGRSSDEDSDLDFWL